jgi:hypothetical protein
METGKNAAAKALRAAQLYLYRHPGQIKELARGAPLVAKGARLPETAPAAPQAVELRRAPAREWAAFMLSGLGR